jgi:hypothetical protein
MPADAVVLDMASQSEGRPHLFLKKDYLSILDNQAGQYGSNNFVLDTSQISNSNKFVNYREAYLFIPLLLTLTAPAGSTFSPATAATSADFVMGLKNWIGTIIHSFTLDFNGTTILSQVPYLPMYNTFKLVTTFSLNDILTQGSSIGFNLDTSTSWAFTPSTATTSVNGKGTSNNQNLMSFPVVQGAFNSYLSTNEGFLRRQMYYNLNPSGLTSPSTTSTFASLLSASNMQATWKSYIFNTINATASAQGVFQQQIGGIVYLKHLSSFFNEIPLLKGTFFKMTAFISNTSVQFEIDANKNIINTSVTAPLAGVNPLMIASAYTGNGSSTLPAAIYTASICVGSKCLNTLQVAGANLQNSSMANVTLNVPAYSFAPIFEQAYLSEPIKKIVYTDIYQYQQQNVVGNFNFLVTNGISNQRKIIMLPYYTATSNGGLDPYASPFDPAGAGPTSPMCIINNLNFVVSGQNMLYNSVRYSWEMWLQQVYGINSINNGQIDGLCSSLIGQQDFENIYNYYVVDVSRKLPVEDAVPMSINIVGQNLNTNPLNLFVFVEYGVEISVDVLTGVRC